MPHRSTWPHIFPRNRPLSMSKLDSALDLSLSHRACGCAWTFKRGGSSIQDSASGGDAHYYSHPS